MSISVLVADDHTLFREGLRALLESIPDIQVLGEASNGQESINKANALQPDIILMDIQMPEQNGIQATRRILEKSPDIGIIIVTMLEDDDSVFADMRAGARGYVLKGADQDEMLRSIRAVAKGEALFGPGIAKRLMRFFKKTQPQLEAETFPELTDREREILERIALGENNAKIAERFTISPKTVSNHVSIIYSKLQVADRVEAMLRAREAGFGQSNAG